MKDHSIPWAEIPAPAEAIQCRKCSLCSQRARVLWGEGNPEAPVMIILDNPGAREDKEGRPFVCGTRLTLREAMSRSGLTHEDVYLTYLLKCRPTRKYKRDESRTACLSYLQEQLADTNPYILVCMGNVVLQTLFSPDSEVKELRGKWLALRGIPTMVTYHPLAARRRPNLLKYVVDDLTQVAERLDNLIHNGSLNTKVYPGKILQR